MVEGCWVQFSVASELPLTTVQFVLLDSWCHLSTPSELISLELPPRSVLLLGLSLMGCCHDLKVHYLWVVIQIVHGIMQLLENPMKEKISQVLLDFTWAQHHKIFLLNNIEYPLQMGNICWHLFCLSFLQLEQICSKILKDATIPYMSSSVFIISDTGSCGSRYWRR